MTRVPFSLIFLFASIIYTPQCLAEWFKQHQDIMGTPIRVELWHNDPEQAQQAIQSVMEEMRRVDIMMSSYKPDSDLSRINQQAASHAVKVNPELLTLIKKSIQFSELTKGAFDITFASIGRLYDYRKKIHPSDQEIKKNINKINYKNIILDHKKNTIRYAIEGVYIDLGGIAKGHAVDQSIALLNKAGIKHAIVTAGGDSRIIGDRNGRPWVIGIRDPRKARTVKGSIPLVNSALSTSGDYERYFIADGEHYHHILTPATGRSAKHVRSVTIIAADATTTDALSTSIFVMGIEKGLQLINSLKDVEAVIINNNNELIFSEGLLAQTSKPK